MSLNNNIKRGVSLYSFQEEFYLGKMNLEECIDAVSNMGADGIELLGEQMLPNFPNITDEFVEQWFEWMKKYNTTPVAYDAFLDSRLYKNRVLTEDEQVEMMVRDIKIANKLGFTILRTLVSTPLNVIEKSLPFAEKYNVKIALEVHSPFTFGTPWIEERIAFIESKKTRYFGLMPDLGIFVKKMAPVMEQWHIRHGANPDFIKYVSDAYFNEKDKNETIQYVKNNGGNEMDVKWAEMASHFVFTDPNLLTDHMDKIIHVHGKFYEFNENYEEPSIPYKDIIDILIKGGYEGYICSEYEGNRHIQDFMEVDSVEQVRRQHVTLKKLLGV